jgi:hypothetical protein
LLLFLSVVLKSQTPQIKDFMGVNLLCEDPIQYVNCVGFAREYHEWQIDEGNVYQDMSIKAYPYNKFKWSKAYNTYTRFPDFYTSISQNLGYSGSGLIPISVSLKSCLPRLSGTGDYPPAAFEFKPVITNESSQIEMPQGGTSCQASITSNLVGNIDLGTVKPCEENSSENPSSYLWYADWATHFSKAFSNNNTDSSFPNHLLKLAEGDNSKAGMNQVGYVEVWNEQDKDWFNVPTAAHNMAEFSATEYAAMSSFTYDGWNQWPSLDPNTAIDHIKGDFESKTQVYNIGVKYGANLEKNSNFKYVFGGLSDIDTKFTDYVDEVKNWCEINRQGSGKVFPFDVINFHHYSDNNSLGTNSDGGVSPESDYMTDKVPNGTPVPEEIVFPAEYNLPELKINKPLKFRLRELYDIYKGPNSKYAKDTELWLSEFGYDTNKKSPQRVPIIAVNGTEPIADQQEVQGRWLVRSFLEIAAAKWDKAMAFFLRDINSNADNPGGAPEGLFQSSGLLLDRFNQYAPKKSYFYVYTMKNALGGLTYCQELNAFDQDVVTNGSFRYLNRWRYEIPEMNPRPRIYHFSIQDDGNIDESKYPTLAIDDALAVWMPTSNNSKILNYKLRFENFPFGLNSVLITDLQVGSTVGTTYSTPVYTDADGKKYIIIRKITERPLFIKFSNGIAPPPVACVTFTGASAISCDAVRVTWSPQSNIAKYLVYYYDKKDSRETNPPLFDLNDTDWKLYTDNFPGNSSSIVVAGLGKLQDNYYIAVIPVNAAGAIPPPTSICAIQVAKTGSCFGGINPKEIKVLNPSNLVVNTLFDYDPSQMCYPLRNPYTTEWADPINHVNLVLSNANTSLVVDAVSIYDATGEGAIELKFDVDNIDNNGNEVKIPYFTEQLYVWKTFPIPSNMGFVRLTITASDDFARISRIILYGRKSNVNYTPLNCCAPTDVVIIGATGVTTPLTTFNAQLGNNSTVIVRGKINVNSGNLTLTDKTLIMDQAAEFEVQNGKTMQIVSSNFQACDLMWKGITMQPGSKVLMTGVTIRDAYQPLLVNRFTGTGIPPKSYFRLEKSFFEGNLNGLYVNPNTTTNSDINNLVSVEGTTFDGLGYDIREPYPAIANVWKPVTNNGMFLNNMNRMLVLHNENNSNDDEFTINPSVFRRMDFGIIGNSIGKLDVSNSFFENILPEVTKYSGRGIFLKNSYLKQRGFGKEAFTPDNISDFFQTLSFKNVATPIFVGTNCSYDIQDNTMWDVGSVADGAINGSRNANNGYITTGASIIANNNIITLQNGVVLEDLAHPAIVKDNNIENYLERTIMGIRASGYGSNEGGVQRIDIHHNSLRLRSSPTTQPDIGAAIHLSNLYNPNIEANRIIVENFNLVPLSNTVPAIYGIHSTAVREATFCRNNIDGWSRAYGNGIHFVNTTNSDLASNIVSDLRFGLSFAATSMNAERLKCNTLKDDGHAVWSANTTMLGKQSTKKNCWDGLYAPLNGPYDPEPKYAAVWEGYHNNIELSQNRFEVTSNGLSCWNPPLNSIIADISMGVSGASTYFSQVTGNTDICSTDSTTLPCFTNHIYFGNTKDDNVGYKYATGESTTPETWTKPMRWILDRDIYRDLRQQYGAISSMPSALQTFAQAKKYGKVGQFYEVEKSIEAIRLASIANKIALDELNKKIATEENDYSNSTTGFWDLSSSEKLTYLEQHPTDGLQANVDRVKQKAILQQQIDVDQNAAINAAKTANNALVVDVNYEKDEQTINGIYLNFLQTGEFMADDVANIEPIADKCPEVGGVAVFKAR